MEMHRGLVELQRGARVFVETAFCPGDQQAGSREALSALRLLALQSSLTSENDGDGGSADREGEERREDGDGAAAATTIAADADVQEVPGPAAELHELGHQG